LKEIGGISLGRLPQARTVKRQGERGLAKGFAHDIGETLRDRKPWPPSITRVDTITRKGIGVSPRPCPVAAMANAAPAPIPSGSSNTHRLCTAAPTSKAIARTRMIVMGGRMPRALIPVQPAARAACGPSRRLAKSIKTRPSVSVGSVALVEFEFVSDRSQ